MKDDGGISAGSEEQGGEGPRAPSIEELLGNDDFDAAWRFFAGAREQSAVPRRGSAAEAADDLSRFRARRMRQRLLSLLDALVVAVEQRDLDKVLAVLDENDACRCFPSAVREEALLIVRLPRSVARPPMRLYRYYHLLTELGDEPMEKEVAAGCAPEVVPDSGPGPEPAREIAFPDRRPPGGGPARRSSGSR